jgi:hypothetical protein
MTRQKEKLVAPTTLEEVQQYTDKDVLIHLVQPDSSLKETTGKIMVATEAGIGFKEKGKASAELLTLSQIEEIAPAPAKVKSVVQKKIKPIEMGQARQHLIDRHGVELSWGKEADEKAAFEYHAGLDHSNLGHIHVEPKEKSNSEEE